MRVLSLLTLAATAAIALPATASAATIAYEGDTLVYRAGAERNWVYIGSGAGGRIRISDGFVDATYPADRCADTGGDGFDCDLPARIRLELGDGNDRNSFSDGYTGTTPVEVHGEGGDDGLEAHLDAPTAVRLDGGAGNDTLRGYGSDDVLLGGSGDDQLTGAGGADELRGGDGNDKLVPDDGAAPAADVVDGGPGIDLLQDYVQYSGSGSLVYPPVELTLDGGGPDGRPGEGDDVLSIERVTSNVSGRFILTDAAEEADIVANMDGGASHVEGRGGNDVLTGHDQVETIDGGAGDDRIEGGFNHDTLIGGPGKDLIYGDRTSSCGTSTTVCVPFGNDVIDARDGEADVIDCGPGTDRAAVDELDVFANCETVDRSGAAPGPAAPGGQGQPGTPVGAAATVKGSRSISTVVRRGLVLRLTGATPGKRTITAKLGKRVVARGTGKVSSRGTATVRLTFTRAGKAALRGKRKATLAISGAGLTTTLRLG